MAQLRTLNEVLENIEFFDTRKHLKKAGGFYSARWNFIKRFKVIGRNDTTGSCLMFGSGPFIHLITEKQGPAKNEEVELETRLCVFEDTNTTVEGIEYLRCAFFLIWGGPYFAIVQVEKVMLGGIVCRGDIVSAGKQILTAKVYDHPNSKNYPAVELYFIDGTMQELTAIRQGRGYEEIPEEIEWQNAMTLYNTYRLPLKPGETLTAAYTGSLGAFIGTSQGRLIAIKDTAIQFVIEPFINDAIKQIVVQHSAVTDVPTLLLFENGTIVSRKNKKRLKKLEGRYTCISDYIFELGDNFAKGEKYIIAGDRDGTVTVIRVDNGHLEIFRTFKNRTFTAITCMVLFSQSYTLLATEAGELQYFDMTQLYRAHPYAPPTGKPIKDKKDVPPSYVVDSNCYYKASVGWFYLRDDKFCRTVPNIPQGHITLLEGKKLNMKYFLACGVPDREIALAYNTSEFNICIIDFTTKVRRTLLKTFGGHQDSGPFRIIQVILMASHVLLQHDTGHAELFMFDWISKSLTSVVYLTKTSGRITAAVCIEYDRNYETSVRYPFDFMMTYLDGSATVRNIDWNGDGSLKRSINFPYVADLKGSYFVSAIASGEHIGNMQCLLLSRKGIVYLAVKGQWPGQKDQVYTTIVQQDLSGILGHGHSLMETCGGILATGFKRHTLKVCRLFMGVKKSRTYCHLFSVDTRSSRLPYTVIEEKLLADHAMTGRVTTKQLIVSYYNKSGGITEEFFSQYDTKFINGTKHTGIITSCFVRDIFKDILQYFYSGDTNGNFCVWSFDDKAVTGQTYLEAFKMDGAVTAIHDIYPYTAVSTSQGGEHY